MRLSPVRLAAVLALALAAGCGDRPDPRAHVPEAFAAVPGDVALMVADPAAIGAADAGAAPPAAQVDAALRTTLDRFAAAAGLHPTADVPPGILAWSAPALPTGWPDLRTSASFQDAWAALPAADAGGTLVAYADLQLLVDVARRHWRDDLPAALRGGVDALGAQALRWAMATVQRGPGGHVAQLDATIRSSDARRGVVALLRAAQPPAAALLAVDTADTVVLDFGFDPVVARHLVDDLVAADRDAGPGAMFGAVSAGLRQLLGAALGASDGRAAIRRDADGRLRLALGVVDPSAAAALLARFGRALDDGVYQLPGGRHVALDGRRLVWLPTADAPLPASGASADGAAGAALRLWCRPVEDVPFTLTLRRRDAANLRLRVTRGD